MSRVIQTIVYVLNNQGQVLLGLKKPRAGVNKERQGVGYWNGFGGDVENGETTKECAVRELKAECGLEALSIEKCGVVLLRINGKQAQIELHLFLVREFRGELQTSDEMEPGWFNIKGVPYKKMWPSDEYFLSDLLAGKKCAALFHLKKEGDVILECVRRDTDLNLAISSIKQTVRKFTIKGV